MTDKNKILIICGPTASGKTSLALQLAKALPKANILSVDSRQVYQGLDLITGKDIPNDLPKTVQIFGLDIFKPDEKANVADFVRYADKIIESSAADGTPIIIVGGTGLYLKGITEHPKDMTIPPDPELRQKLEKLSLSELQNTLQEKDETKFSALNKSDSMNPRRLVRYIEIARASKTIVESKPNPLADYVWVGILPDKNTIKSQIKKRVVQRIKNGAIKEVQNLLRNYPDTKLPIYTSLGVSQICSFLDDKISKEKLVEIWTNAEVDYARRQIVWFKKQKNIVWYDKSISQEILVQKLKKIYLQND